MPIACRSRTMTTTYCKRYGSAAGCLHCLLILSFTLLHPLVRPYTPIVPLHSISHLLHILPTLSPPLPPSHSSGRAIPSVFDPSSCFSHPRQPPPRQAMVHGPRRSLDHRHHDHPQYLLCPPFRNARRHDDGLEPGQGVLGSSGAGGGTNTHGALS